MTDEQILEYVQRTPRLWDALHGLQNRMCCPTCLSAYVRRNLDLPYSVNESIAIRLYRLVVCGVFTNQITFRGACRAASFDTVSEIQFQMEELPGVPAAPVPAQNRSVPGEAPL